jgi:hypothetical protein
VRIAAKKADLGRLRPLSPQALINLDHSYGLELTYTSNAIEGNPLTQTLTDYLGALRAASPQNG